MTLLCYLAFCGSLSAYTLTHVQVTTTTIAGTLVPISLQVRLDAGESVSTAKLYYDDGGTGSAWNNVDMQIIDSTYVFTSSLRPTVMPVINYYFAVRISGSLRLVEVAGVKKDRNNPFSISLIEPDIQPPYIIHLPDSFDDEDDGPLGKYQGQPFNGVPDEDEDAKDSDPADYQPKDHKGFTDDDTGTPWGIKETFVKNGILSIKAIFKDYSASPSFTGKAFLIYRNIPGGAWVRSEMRGYRGVEYGIDLPRDASLADIEYFFTGIDANKNISVSDLSCYMYSHDGIDNDGDGKIDEETKNGVDDDGDGFVDEDLSQEGEFLMKGSGYSVTKSSIGFSLDPEEAQGIINYFRVRPFKMTARNKDSLIVPAAGTYGYNIDNKWVKKPVLFADGTSLEVEPGTFPEDVRFELIVSSGIPKTLSGSSVKETGFVRELKVYDSDNKELRYFSKPVILIFHLPLFLSQSDFYLCYYYDGIDWVKAGGQQSSIDEPTQVGYDHPYYLSVNHSGLFSVFDNKRAWDSKTQGNMTELEALPKIFSPNNDNMSDFTTVKFIIASNDTAPTIGDTELMIEFPLTIKVFNLAGDHVRTVCENTVQRFRWQYGSVVAYSWDGRDDFGNVVPAGIYLIEARTGRSASTWLTYDKEKTYRGIVPVVVVR